MEGSFWRVGNCRVGARIDGDGSGDDGGEGEREFGSVGGGLHVATAVDFSGDVKNVCVGRKRRERGGRLGG